MGSANERPKGSIAQDMTTSNCARPASFSILSRPERLTRPLAPLKQEFWTGLPSSQGCLDAVADLLVFNDPEPPAATAAPIRTRLHLITL
jgi:hypothetical protein